MLSENNLLKEELEGQAGDSSDIFIVWKESVNYFV